MKNYLYKISGDSTLYGTRYAPQVKDYNGFGDYFDGKKWYYDVATFSDDFTDDITGWIASEATGGVSSTISHENGKLKVLNSGATYGSAYTTISTIAGKRYKVITKGTADSGTVSATALILNHTEDTATGAFVNIDFMQANNLEFTASGTTLYVTLYNGSTADAYGLFDGVAIIPLNDDGTVDTSSATAYTTPRTYLGLTADIDTQGNITNIDYWDMPTFVEDTIVAKSLSTTKSITAGTEFVGKNACTAWVNFDGTTTPPTIRDSYNVSMVVRTATGNFDIYFEEPMEDGNYTVVSSHNSYTFSEFFNTVQTKEKSHIQTFSNVPAAIDRADNKVQFFGGK